MLKIEQFVDRYYGIKLTSYQLGIITMIAANPEEKFILSIPSSKAAGKTTAIKSAMAYLQDGMKPVATGSIKDRALEWALSGDTGVSSETLCAFMSGVPVHRMPGAPSDSSDRGRCIQLLKLIPEWIPRLNELTALDDTKVSINGADPVPYSQTEHSWTYQIPLIIEEGGF